MAHVNRSVYELENEQEKEEVRLLIDNIECFFLFLFRSEDK